MLIPYIIGASILFQCAAALMAVRLISVTNKRISWLLIALAMVIMALRRILPFSNAVTGNYGVVDPLNESAALMISILLTWGMHTIAPILSETKSANVAREMAETTLRESEVNLRLAHEAGNIGVWKTNMVTRVMRLDERARLHFGMETLDTSLDEILARVHPDDISRLRDEICAVSQPDSEGVLQTEYRVIHPDQQVHWLAIHGSVAYSRTGPDRKAVLSFGTAQDITERVMALIKLEELNQVLETRVVERTAELSLANAELIRANLAKDEFLSVMSHELRTPLNAILTLSEALQEGIYGALDAKQADRLNTIQESGEHLLEMINDILDLSKIEASRLDMHLESVSVDGVCQSSLRLVRQQAQKKRLQISTTMDPNAEVINADERRLKQMLVNLLSNAVKFTRDEGQIGLEVAYESGTQALRFTVWDTGIGIPRDKIGQLFQPFVQLDSALARENSGTGLGLVLVRRLAEQMGGSVGVESEPGVGSRFWFVLPVGLVRPKQLTPTGLDGQPKAAPLPDRLAVIKANILIAEDNETNLHSLNEYLQAKGYGTIQAVNGNEALARAQACKPDLILMDIQMPNMDGLEVIKRLRALPDFATTPIIALTALAMPGDRERCLAAGADEYLAKPVPLKELLSTVERRLAQ